MKLPKKLFVKIEVDGDTSYPLAAESPEDLMTELGDTLTVGHYKLTKTSMVKAKLVIKKKR